MNRTRTEQGLFAAAAVAVIAVFLPWLKIIAPFVGSITTGPTDGSDGYIMIGFIAVTVLLAWFQKRTAALVAAGLTAALVAYEVIHVITGVNEVMAGEAGDMIATSYGAGLYIIVAATIALVVFAVKNRKAPTAAVVEADADEFVAVEQ